MFVNKHFINTGAHIPKSKQFYNGKPSAYYFYLRTKIPLNFRICINVPLTFELLFFETVQTSSNSNLLITQTWEANYVKFQSKMELMLEFFD